MTREILYRVYQNLFNKYGPQNWWPAESDWEMAVGAILTQNTSWTNVEKALDNLRKINALNHESMAKLSQEELAELIKPSGFFRIKADRLQHLINWWGPNSPETGKNDNLSDHDLRKSLLSIKGVGEETADCILLYAYRRPSFVIDAYTKRLFSAGFEALQVKSDLTLKSTYHQWQTFFMENLDHDVQLFNEYHALIVEHMKQTKGKDLSVFK